MFLLFSNNKTKHVKKFFSALLFVCFYPAVPNFNHNKHIKHIVDRSTVNGTFVFFQLIILVCDLWFKLLYGSKVHGAKHTINVDRNDQQNKKHTKNKKWCFKTKKNLVQIKHVFNITITNAKSACHPPGSINEYQRKLGSKRAYHTMHWPRSRGLAASAGVWLRAMKRKSAPPHPAINYR